MSIPDASSSMEESNSSGNNDGSPSSKSSDEIEDLTEHMVNLWWHDTTSDEISADGSLFSNSINEGDGIWVDKSKYHKSRSIQATMEKIWAKELYEMNSKEREDINNEIHGVRSSRAVDETPELVSRSIVALRHHIEQRLNSNPKAGVHVLNTTTREAYQRVLALVAQEGHNNLPYIQTEKFLIKFLRASFFDVNKAGKRYFRWLDLMHEMFGDIALQRSLMLIDLTPREQEYLRKGQIQLLSCRDRIGRRIFVYSGREDKSFTSPEKSRASMYLFDVCSDDETTQKLGMVIFSSPRVERGNKPFGKAIFPTEKEFYRRFRNGTALRISAMHFTGPGSFVYNVGKALVLLTMGKADRGIVRFHQGTVAEWSQSLRSYGIPIDEVPLTEGGQVRNKRVAKFMAARKTIEDSRQEQLRMGKTSFVDPGTECPEVNCVTFGNRTRSNSANLEFRNILLVMDEERENRANRGGGLTSVREFVDEIIRTAQSSAHNLRFVSFDKETSLFVEATDARELFTAISQFIRDERKRRTKAKRELESSPEQPDSPSRFWKRPER